ncbi:hypothetical protein P7K49_012139 [Saguinus oedipus]|uniref:Uncharacterized protein n=1 Tax=Saguinus oedipus TaxID=9490 RepID=A0ABQ9VSX2_SAGOE|nr:hypothetical protein P7K49_012139 [Saguinus oedipus]
MKLAASAEPAGSCSSRDRSRRAWFFLDTEVPKRLSRDRGRGFERVRAWRGRATSLPASCTGGPHAPRGPSPKYTLTTAQPCAPRTSRPQSPL